MASVFQAPWRRALRLVLFAALAAPPASASTLALDGQPWVSKMLGDTVQLTVSGTPGAEVILLADVDDGPLTIFGQQVAVGGTPFMLALSLGPLPPGGELSLDATVPSLVDLDGQDVFLVAAVLDPQAQGGVDFSAGARLRLTLRRAELVGRPLAGFPFFQHVKAVNQGTPVQVGVDAAALPLLAGQTADVYVCPHKTLAQWLAQPLLADVSGDGPETFAFTGATLQANTLTVDPGSLPAANHTTVGRGYDVVLDLNRDGFFDPHDFVDGAAEEAGFYAVSDLTQPGPYASVTEVQYSLGVSFSAQDLYYPSNIGALGELPLVVVSHGNGHNYTWYDHIGFHLASWGYIVMSHANNTQPGPEAASTTTLSNTDGLLGNLATIAGGALVGHVDSSRMTWIGHSRGGEGVVRAYNRVLTGQFVPQHFTAADVRLVSSMAPTDFLGFGLTHPKAVNYHLWTGGADADVWGCAQSDNAQTFQIHDRAEQYRQSISLHGVGHGDFHASVGSVATGPCLVGKTDTHTIMRGYLVPLLARYVHGNVPSRDFLSRQWEEFRPIGAPAGPCVVVDLMYREGDDGGKFVLDDFQANPTVDTSSSGGPVTFTVSNLREGQLNDANSTFTNDAADVFNGFTGSGSGDDSRGIVFDWDGSDAFLRFGVPAAARDWRAYRVLSFRAAQATRHPLTAAVLGDLTFAVALRDGSGTSVEVDVGSIGGGVEEPYQRTACGTGAGWANEFETLRLPLAAFTTNATGLDLADVADVELRFGPTHGAAQGRIGLDDLEILKD